VNQRIKESAPNESVCFEFYNNKLSSILWHCQCAICRYQAELSVICRRQTAFEVNRVICVLNTTYFPKFLNRKLNHEYESSGNW